MSAERAYRVVDGIYRVHRDLFAIEAVLSKTAHIHVRLAKVSTNGRMATLVAGMLVLVPILVSLGDIKWGSVPAVVIYVVTLGSIFLWLWQVREANKAETDLSSLESETVAAALENREDFALEEINASVTRHHMVEAIVESLTEMIKANADSPGVQTFGDRQRRYEEILRDEADYVEELAARSLAMVSSGHKSKEDHEVLLDWCRGIRGFKGPAPP